MPGEDGPAIGNTGTVLLAALKPDVLQGGIASACRSRHAQTGACSGRGDPVQQGDVLQAEQQHGRGCVEDRVRLTAISHRAAWLGAIDREIPRCQCRKRRRQHDGRAAIQIDQGTRYVVVGRHGIAVNDGLTQRAGATVGGAGDMDIDDGSAGGPQRKQADKQECSGDGTHGGFPQCRYSFIGIAREKQTFVATYNRLRRG